LSTAGEAQTDLIDVNLPDEKTTKKGQPEEEDCTTCRVVSKSGM